MRLEHSIVLITGASSGIGRALAFELAKRNATLVLASRREKHLNEVARELTAIYPQLPTPLVIGCDVSSRESVHAMTESCIRELGRIDALINCAGISIYGDSAETPVDDIHSVLEVNFFGALHSIIELLPHMKRNGRGLIVNVASLAAIHGVPYLGAYGASKAALVAFSQSLRAELAGSGISVLNVYPDYTQTALFEHEKRSGGARRPYRGYVSSAAVAKAIARAIIKDRREVILSPRGKVLSILQGVWPSFVEKKMRFIADRLRERKEYSHA